MSFDSSGNVAQVLLDYVEQNRTFQSERITRVPYLNYTDPERWAREMALIFRKLPLMLALTAELPKPGDYKAMTALNLPVLLTRGQDAVVRAFLNVCSHRGAPVVADGHGRCARFTCLYHGWTFASDGRLLAVTDREKFGEVDKAGLGLTALPCVEKSGMIFVVLTPGAPIDADDFYGPMLDDFAAAGLANWTFLGSRVIEGANWKVAFDGYLEGYHFATLHPKTIHPRTPSNVTHYEAHGPHLRIGFPQVSIRDLRQVPRPQWDQQENHGFDYVRILFPNVSAFLAPELAQIAQLFPGPTPDRNRTVLLYVRRDPPKDAADREATEKMIDFLRDVTYQEDYVLGLRIQQGLESGAHDSIVLGRNERGNQYFHEYVEWYLKNDPRAPRPVL
jgi:phenylpropionate dioxygenase-like ring-hydroxylating dioxygenase large terminal subunit